MNRKINLDELHKVESSSVIPLARQGSEMVQGIIKVTKPDYVPECVHLRASMGPHIFTAEFKQADLAALESDPKVESVSISKNLQSAK